MLPNETSRFGIGQRQGDSRGLALHTHTPTRASLLRLAVETIDSRCLYDCAYCPFARSNGRQARRAIAPQRLLADARSIASLGYDWFVLQAGQLPGRELLDWTPWISRIAEELPDLQLMAAVGDQPRDIILRLQNAGIRGFWLSTECAEEHTFDRLKPCGRLDARRRCIQAIIDAGADLITGLTLGLPGVSMRETIATIDEAASLRPAMIGINVFAPGFGTRCHTAPSAPLPLIRAAIRRFKRRLPQTPVFVGCPVQVAGVLDYPEAQNLGADGFLMNIDSLPIQPTVSNPRLN